MGQTGRGPVEEALRSERAARSAAEAALARADFDKALLLARGEASDAGILVVSPDGRVISSNQRFAQLWRLPEEALATTSHEVILAVLSELVSDPAGFRQRVGALSEDPSETAVDEVRLSDGRVLERYAGPVRGPGGVHYGRIWRYRDISRRKRAEARLAVLAEMPTTLDDALGAEERLLRLARLVVPRLADLCTVRLRDGDDLRLAAVAHADPAREPEVRDLYGRHRGGVGEPGLARVVTTGRSELIADLTDALMVEGAPDAEFLRGLRALAPTSYMCVPLVARGEPLGALAMLTSVSGRRFGPDDLALAEELGRRAGLAVDNARLYEAERRARRGAERSAERMARLQRVTAALSQAVSLGEVAEVIVLEGVAALEAAAGIVALRNGARCEVLRAIGYPEETIGPDRMFALDAAMPLATVISSGRDLWLESGAELLRRFPAASMGPPTVAAVPLIIHGRVIGGLTFRFAEAQRDFSGDERAFVRNLAEQCAQALERARLFEAERDARQGAERAIDRVERLQRVTEALSGSLTPAQVAAVTAEQAMAALGAEAVWVGVLDERATGFEVAHVAGVDPVGGPTLSVDAATPLVEAARIGAPLVELVGHEIAERFPAFRTALPDCGRVASVTLSVSGEALGLIALTFGSSDRLPAADREFLLALARLCAQAMQRARVYAVQREIAQTLQRSLLPRSLPRVAGVAVAVRYLAGAQGAEVGGDWYEAIELPEGRVGLAVGDVVGHGIAAAAVMGQLRSALRAFARSGASPSTVLSSLSAFADGVDGAQVATVVYAVLDPARGEVAYSCAGHPPPLVVGSDGRVSFLEGARNLPLAALPAVTYEEASAALTPGSTLLLYTDGAVERRGEGVDDGLARLREAAREAASEDPEPLCTHLLERLFEHHQPADDVALLAVRLALRPPERLEIVAPARAEELSRLRWAVGAWLRAAGAGADEAHDVMLACGEACANAIDHAYPPDEPGQVQIRLEGDGADGIVLSVRDFGRWRPPPVDRGERGRGIVLMRELMDGVRLVECDPGTEVVMRRRFAAQGDVDSTRRDGHPRRSAAAPNAAEMVRMDVESRDGWRLVRLTGEVDSSNAARLGERLWDVVVDGRAVVDLSELGYLDSAGVKAFIELAVAARGNGGTLCLVVPPGARSARAITLSGLHDVIPVRASMEEALAGLEGFSQPPGQEPGSSAVRDR